MMKRKQLRNLLAVLIILVMLPLFVNHRPLYVNYNGHLFFPALSGNDVIKAGDKEINLQFGILPDDAFFIPALIPWSPGRSDLQNSYAGPFDEQLLTEEESMPLYMRHWMGTDGKGADVLAGILYGFRYSVFLGLVALLIGAVPGIFLGSVAAFYADKGKKIHYAFIPAFLVSLIYFICTWKSGILSVFIALMLYLLIYNTGKLISGKKFHVPLDQLIMGFMSLLVSVPALIIIITVSVLFQPSLWSVAIILGILLWPDVVRFTRAQVLQIRNEDFVTAAMALGYSNWCIIIYHLLRNGITPVLILLCFSFSNIILTEAALSFLGAGLPSDVVTWGSLLAAGRENFQAWWLVVFPGVLLMLVIFYLITFADRYQSLYKAGKTE